jgi:hypothetical protein
LIGCCEGWQRMRTVKRIANRMTLSIFGCTGSLRGIFAPEFLDHGLRGRELETRRATQTQLTAKASGFTPLSIMLTHVARVSLSS